MQGLQNLIKRSGLLTVALSFVALLITGAVMSLPQKTEAASLTTRSMNISSSSLGSITTGAAGSGSNGQKAKYTFTFTLGTSGSTVGSLSIMLCTTPIPATGSCTTPTGLDASHVASIQNSGSTGLLGTVSLDTTTTDPSNSQGVCNGGTTVRTNCILLKWSSATVQTGTPTITLVFGGGASDYITNPTTAGTFFARITTYSDTAYTTAVDAGTTANSTATQVTITAKVQEALNFSVGTTVTAPGTSCTAFTDSGALSIGDPTNGLSATTAYDGHSYFRVATNGIHGTTIYYSAPTLTSGANSIAAINGGTETSTGTSSSPGTAQFGLGIDTSDTQSGSGYSFSSLAATANPAYGSAAGTITAAGTAKFNFNPASATSPIAIASTANVITCDTGSVRYLANIATNTPPGIYTTTVNYIATPSY